MNLKGYVSVRIPVPVSVQNLVIRDYCNRNGHTYSLSDVEFLSGYHMLEGLLAGLHTFDGICAYSLWLLPEHLLYPDDKPIHLALENYILPRDLEICSQLRSIKKAME